MPDLSGLQTVALLAAYTTQNASVAASNRLIRMVRDSSATAPAAPTVSGKSITLNLVSTITAPAATVTPTSFAGPGTPPIVQTQGTTTAQGALITFDVSPDSADGYAQSVRYTARARQSIHQTAGGFYVDEFGFAPGSLVVEAIVAATSGVVAGVAAFRDLLARGKLSNPLLPIAAPSLIYVNSIDGMKLLLTQTTLDIAQLAENPNQARMTITADVLRDFGAAAAPGTAAAAAAPTSPNTLLSLSDGTTVLSGGLANLS